MIHFGRYYAHSTCCGHVLFRVWTLTPQHWTMFLNIHSSFSSISNLVQILWKGAIFCSLFCFMAVYWAIKCSNHGVNNIKVTFGSQENLFWKVMKAFRVTKSMLKKISKNCPNNEKTYTPIQKSIMLCHRVNSMGITSLNITVLTETPRCSTILFFCMGWNQKSGIPHC